LTYSYVAFLTGLVLFVDVLTDRNFFFRRQSAAIFLGSLAPICAALIYPLGLSPLPGFDFVLFGLAINGALFGYAFFATEFYDIIPAIRAVGWDRMADQIDSGIVVTDMQTRIIEVNQTINQMFGTTHEEVTGKPVTYLFEDAAVGETVEGAYEFTKRQGSVFEVQWTAVRDRQGRRIGYTYTVTDITERKRREQQLQVLNRALRHNLRNKVNVISAHSERIERLTEEGVTADRLREDAVAITQAAGRIDEIGETARRVEKLIQDAEVDRVDLHGAVRASVESVSNAYPDAEIVNNVSEKVRVGACPGIGDAFTEILKNSFQHNDPAETSATVELQVRAADVVLRFIDDGEGIPEHELEAIENGRENALEHASGLGLWFIKWITEASGGELAIDSGPMGTTIELVLLRDFVPSAE
jgi:PAS domain S-box-containing protein